MNINKINIVDIFSVNRKLNNIDQYYRHNLITRLSYAVEHRTMVSAGLEANWREVRRRKIQGVCKRRRAQLKVDYLQGRSIYLGDFWVIAPRQDAEITVQI